jgi:HD-GYP domain-containing protein (c-di-GMP phosphodiesterase class II)
VLKRGRLADEERTIMQTHTTHGAAILAGSAYSVLTPGYYKPAWPLAAAVEEIVHASGTDFDPRVIDAFQQLLCVGALDPLLSGLVDRQRPDVALG